LQVKNEREAEFKCGFFNTNSQLAIVESRHLFHCSLRLRLVHGPAHDEIYLWIHFESLAVEILYLLVVLVHGYFL
jgi:hypothetical protein